MRTIVAPFALAVITLAAGVTIARAAPALPVETDPSGCRLELVAGDDGRNLVFHQGVSPDGRRLAIGWDRKVGETTTRGAFVLDLETGERAELPGLNNAASFSPDGRRLVAANYPGPRELKTEVVELDLASGQTRTLASDPAMEWLPSYSPDGRWIVFNSLRSGGSDIYRVSTDSGTVTRLTEDPRYEAHGDISPDGDRVVFHRQIAGDDYGLAILDLGNGAVRELPGQSSEEAYPAWAPDGRRLSLSSDELQAVGQGDIYLADDEGRLLRRLTAHPAKDAYSAWSPDGRYLYFVSFRAEGSRVYRLEIIGDDCRRT